MDRRLTLRREHLAELTRTELGAVAGAAATLDCIYVSGICQTLVCLTGHYPTINDPCTTN